MKLYPECIPCLLTVRAREIIRYVKDREEGVNAVIKLTKLVLKLAENVKSGPIGPKIASEAFKFVKEVVKVEDPYKEFKEKSNETARRMLPLFERYIREAEDEEELFRRAVKIAIIGNIIDPGVAYLKGDLQAYVSNVRNLKLKPDNTGEILSYVKRAKRIAYFCDNAGEIIFDMNLMRVIKELNPKVEIYAIVRSKPFQNDVTLDEAYRLGLDKIADKVLPTGSAAPGFILELASRNVIEYIKSCDLLISKGLGNFECLSEYEGYFKKPIAYMLIAKCRPIATELGVEVNSLVAKLVKP